MVSVTRRGRDAFRRHRWLMRGISDVLRLLPLGIRIAFYDGARMWRGLAGIAVRYCLLRATARTVGENVSIGPGVYLLGVEQLSVGDNVSIHPMSYVDATGGLVIGSDVSIAHGVTILSTTHRFDDTGTPIKDQGVECRQTLIEDDVWIGAKATILAGNRVSSGVVVGAGAVVTRDVPTLQVVAGVPAVTISSRKGQMRDG